MNASAITLEDRDKERMRGIEKERKTLHRKKRLKRMPDRKQQKIRQWRERDGDEYDTPTHTLRE